MAKIEIAIRDAIARGARRQVRNVARPLRREVRRLRQALAQLRRDVAVLRDMGAQWQRTVQAAPWKPQVSEAEARAARMSPRLIQKLRRRLGLSQTALARLVRVSAAAVVQWERGRSAPSGPNRGALVALRKLGRREVKRLLAAGRDETPARRRRRRVRRRTPGRRRR